MDSFRLIIYFVLKSLWHNSVKMLKVCVEFKMRQERTKGLTSCLLFSRSYHLNSSLTPTRRRRPLVMPSKLHANSHICIWSWTIWSQNHIQMLQTRWWNCSCSSEIQTKKKEPVKELVNFISLTKMVGNF